MDESIERNVFCGGLLIYWDILRVTSSNVRIGLKLPTLDCFSLIYVLRKT
jgi:hypothetical protein